MKIDITITATEDQALTVAKHYGFQEWNLEEFCETTLREIVINAISMPSQLAINEAIENKRREDMENMKNTLSQIVEINILSE